MSCKVLRVVMVLALVIPAGSVVLAQDGSDRDAAQGHYGWIPGPPGWAGVGPGKAGTLDVTDVADVMMAGPYGWVPGPPGWAGGPGKAVTIEEVVTDLVLRGAYGWVPGPPGWAGVNPGSGSFGPP